MLQIRGRPSINLKTLSQICEKPFQNFKNQPQNWETFMHTVQNLPPKLGDVYAHRAKSSPKTEARLCTPCKIFPQN